MKDFKSKVLPWVIVLIVFALGVFGFNAITVQESVTTADGKTYTRRRFKSAKTKVF